MVTKTQNRQTAMERRLRMGIIGALALLGTLGSWAGAVADDDDAGDSPDGA